MKYDVITIGSCLEDIAFYTDEGVIIENKKDLLRQKLLAFEFGAKIKIEKTLTNFGGGAANAAATFASFGFATGIITAIGDDQRGERIMRNFKQRKISTAMVHKVKGIESTYSVLIIGPKNEHVVFTNRRATSSLEMTDQDLEMAKSAKWIFITSLSGRWENLLDMVLGIKNVNKAWNPGQTQLLKGAKKLKKYLAKIDVLILNKDEAIELVNSAGIKREKERFNDVDYLIETIYKWGPGIIAITDGENGATVKSKHGVVHQGIYKVKKISDTTGVGDAFGSAFVAGLMHSGNDIRKALDIGLKNAASVIEKPGAQNGILSRKVLSKK